MKILNEVEARSKILVGDLEKDYAKNYLMVYEGKPCYCYFRQKGKFEDTAIRMFLSVLTDINCDITYR